MVTTALDGLGAQHIDRIVGQVLDGIGGRPAWVRLIVAADLAAILDRAEVAV